MNRSTCAALALVLVSGTAPGLADEHDGHRQHGAHVHGHAELAVAMDGPALEINLTSPAANFLGFEHAPQTEEQEAAVEALEKTLADPAKLFAIDADAQCALTASTIEMGSLEAGHHDHEEHGHAEHGHDTHEHEAHDHDAHDHEGEEEHHTDIEARYSLTCAKPGALKSITVTLFTEFSGFEEIDAVILSEAGQSAQELDPGRPELTIKP